jgi:hypothetical protein
MPEPEIKRDLVAGLFFACFILLFFACIVLPTGYDRGASSERIQCLNNIKNINLALLNYADQNGHFPPPYIADENGKPMHSWRVLILPLIDERALYDQYNFDEPWDGPDNSKLADKMPAVFSSPQISKSSFWGSSDNAFNTSYLLPVGPNTG